jgi:hypothetical protein
MEVFAEYVKRRKWRREGSSEVERRKGERREGGKE